MKQIAIIGFGSRGQMFAQLLSDMKGVHLVAVAEPVEYSRVLANERFGVPVSMCFQDAEAFFRQGKICDALFVCTQDSTHCEIAVRALELGYDICLEKPAAVTLEQCLLIRDTAKRLGRKVMLTHVLRYAPFYRSIRQWIEDGALGEIVHIDQTENVSYWHFALSYVRGPWRSAANSTPSIIAKCCHDLDIICWLMHKKCVRVSSFGQLNFFNQKHAPTGSALYCADCDETTKRNCLFNAYSIYPERVKNPVVGGVARLKGMNIYDVLDGRNDIVGRCVFHAGNDVADNQSVQMEFTDGTTAHLTMTAFSADCHRYIHVHGTRGEVSGDLESGILYRQIYGERPCSIDINDTTADRHLDLRSHGGGDYYLCRDFIEYITNDVPSATRTTIDEAIESHIIGFMAEESRKRNGQLMELKGYNAW